MLIYLGCDLQYNHGQLQTKVLDSLKGRGNVIEPTPALSEHSSATHSETTQAEGGAEELVKPWPALIAVHPPKAAARTVPNVCTLSEKMPMQVFVNGERDACCIKASRNSREGPLPGTLLTDDAHTPPVEVARCYAPWLEATKPSWSYRSLLIPAIQHELRFPP